jgi:hypothetical protein
MAACFMAADFTGGYYVKIAEAVAPTGEDGLRIT